MRNSTQTSEFNPGDLVKVDYDTTWDFVRDTCWSQVRPQVKYDVTDSIEAALELDVHNQTWQIQEVISDDVDEQRTSL